MNNKKIDIGSLNEIIGITKKVMNLVYVVLMLLLVVGIIYICREMMIFSLIVSILKILLPLFAGFIIAWIFSPIVDKLKTKGLSRIAGSLIVYIALIIISGIFFRLFVPVILNQISEFVAYVPSVINSVMNFVNEFLTSLNATGIETENIRLSINEGLVTFSGDITTALSQNAVSIIGSLFSGIIDVVFSLILGLYILIDFDRIQSTMTNLIPSKNKEETKNLFNKIDIEARKTVNGILLIASMVFICDTIGFAIIGLEASLLLGLFCGITDLIPYIGPYIGGIIAVVVGFSQNPVIGIGVLIITILVQSIENYVLQPVVMSKATNIHPIIIMVSLLVFGYFFGIIGMILSTPLLSIIKVIMVHFDEKYKIFEKV